MKTKVLLFAELLAAVCVACSENDGEPTNNDSASNISLNIMIDGWGDTESTRAIYSGFPATEFEEGDQIGVYAVNTSNTTVASNVAFTRQSDGSWTPASAVAYDPDYTYYAYFPYKSSVPSFVPGGSGADGKFTNFLNNNTFWLADQSTKANFTTSNLMWAEGIVTAERTIKFTMQHKRGLAVIGNTPNKWYYSDDSGTKYNMTPAFSGNIPYEESGTSYFLMKPNTATTVASMSLRAAAGKYITSTGIEMMGTPSYTYFLNGSSSVSSKPAWLTVTANAVYGKPTEFEVSATPASASNYRTISEGTNTAEATALKAKTAASNVDLSMVNNDGSAREDGRTTANCYLVHASGTYKIPLVYGNAIKHGSTNRNAYYTTQTSNTLQNFVNHNDAGIYTGNDDTDPWIKNHSITVAGAKLIWQNVQGMISSVGISGDYLTFTVDPDNIAPGNAVIAATTGENGTGDIVWSWHIWVTTETLSNLTTVSAAHTYQLAPVYVGWISSTVRTYTGNTCRVRVSSNGVTLTFDVTQASRSMTISGFHPYYQWGRKDALIPSTGSGNYNHNTWDIDGNVLTSSANNTCYNFVSGAYSIGTTIKNPITHYYNSSNYGPYNETKYNYWDAENTNLDNSYTTSRAVATVKTVYDPCPPDFCVPTSNCFYYIYSNYSSYFEWTSTPAGRTWKMNGANVFFPASGLRSGSNGTLNYLDNYGYCWTATPCSTGKSRYLYFYSSFTGWDKGNWANGFSVPAVAEE